MSQPSNRVGSPMGLQTAEAASSMGSFAALPDDNLFRVHFDNLPGPAYIWRRAGDDFVLIAYNRAADGLSYSKVAALLGSPVSALQASNRHDLLSDLESCAARGIIVKREVEHRYLATGTARTLALTIVPLSADIVVLHTDDITERRLTEQALRESEGKYRTIIENALEGVITIDLVGTILYANQRAAEMIGYTPEEIVGRTTLDFIDGSLHQDALRLRERLHSGVKARQDFRLRHKDGGDVWISAAASPTFGPDGSVNGVIHLITDVTERKRAVQALTASEARVRALLDANPDLIVRITRDGRYLDVHSTDPRMENHLPYRPEDFIGRNVRDMFEPEFARQHERHRLAALATGQMQRWEYVRPDPKGSVRHIEARFVKSGDDEVVVTVRDFTKRVELEREVIASTERERTRIGHDLHDGLAQLLIGVKLLLAALREKLATARSPHEDDAERAVQLVSHAIAQTANLAQGLSPIQKRGRLCDALRQLARQSEQLFGVPCEVLRAEAPGGLGEGAATHLYRIAQEAITNAVKHGGATRIEIACDWLPPRVVLTVADNGAGISDGAADQGGLGLHIMNYRARSLGGHLSVAARPEGGTLVRCSAPAGAE